MCAAALAALVGLQLSRPDAGEAADEPVSISIFDFAVTWSQLVAAGGTYQAPLLELRQVSGSRLFDLVGRATFSLVGSGERLGSSGELVPCAPAPRCYAIEIRARFRLREPKRFGPAMTPSWCAHFNRSPGLISGVSCLASIRMRPLGDGRTWLVRGETWPREEFAMQQTTHISIATGPPICPLPPRRLPSDPTTITRTDRNRLVSETLKDANALLAQRAALAPLKKAEGAVVFAQGVLKGLAELPHLVRDVGVVVYSLSTTGEYPALEPLSVLGQAWKRELEAGTPPWLVATKSAGTAVAITVVPYAAEAFLVGGVAAAALQGDEEGAFTQLAFGFNVLVGRKATGAQPTAPVRACGCRQQAKPSLIKGQPQPPKPYDFRLTPAEGTALAREARDSFAGAGHGLVLVPVRDNRGQGLVLVASRKQWSDVMGLTQRAREARTCTGKAINPQRRWDTEVAGLHYIEKEYLGTQSVVAYGLRDPCPNCRNFMIAWADRTGVPVRYWSAQSRKWFNFLPD